MSATPVTSAETTPRSDVPRITLEDGFDAHRILITKTTDAAQVGTVVKRRLQELGWLHLWAVGPHAINQAVKAACLARRYLRDEGQSLVMVPEWGMVISTRAEPEGRHAVRFTVRMTVEDATDG